MDPDLYARLAATGKPECPQCGYSLEGLPGPHRCPECGVPYESGLLLWRFRRFPGLPFLIVDAPGESIFLSSGIVLVIMLVMNLVMLVWTGTAAGNPGTLTCPAIWIGLLGLLLYLRWRRFGHEYLAIDDSGIAWVCKTDRHHFRWREFVDECLARGELGIVGTTSAAEEFQVPIRLTRLTGLGVDEFLKFLHARCRNNPSHELPDPAADHERDS